MVFLSAMQFLTDGADLESAAKSSRMDRAAIVHLSGAETRGGNLGGG
jgi:hypothetical protein